MHLVELFLPLTDNEGKRFKESLFADICKELADRFGGVTSFSRAPAHGVTEETGRRVHDDMIVIEVMAESLDRDWWTVYRRNLEKRFHQDEILIRSSVVERL